jgi:hypothetical protein
MRFPVATSDIDPLFRPFSLQNFLKEVTVICSLVGDRKTHSFAFPAAGIRLLHLRYLGLKGRSVVICLYTN